MQSTSDTCLCGCGSAVTATWVRGHHSRRSVEQRLAEKTERRGSCLIWTGAVGTSGYGVIGTGEAKKTDYAHRVAYRAAYGEIPVGKHIDHLCAVRTCVNPEHLEAVTQGENNRRAWIIRRGLRREVSKKEDN